MTRADKLHVWLAASTLLLLGSAASANSSGISGQSGKQGMTCNSHHTGGVAPVVRLEGPSIVAAGALATFRFTVESQAAEDQPLAGLNIAASDGELGTIPRQSTQLENGEITHTQPRLIDASGAATWPFTWRAPATGPQTLFAAGNSVDGFATMEGDHAATTQIEVEVGCLGDCGDDSAVTIDEVITAVRLALRGAPPAACALADGNGDGVVRLEELVAAVEHSLEGCD